MRLTAEQRDLAARNDRFAYYVARQCRLQPGMDREDLAQVAALKLTECAARFDSSLGTFASYAGTSIRCALRAEAGKYRPVTSLDAEPNGPGSSLRDQLAAPVPSLAPGDVADLHLLLNRLRPRLRELLCLFFGIGGNRPLTLGEIGQRCHLSRARVGQLVAAALSQLRRDAGRYNTV